MVKNTDLIEEVIRDNSRYIRWLSKKYKVSDEGDHEDLYQEGILSLYSALRNYDDSLGIPFFNYATRYIKSGMNEYIQRNSNIVKFATTHGRRNLFVNSSKIDRDNYDSEELKKRYKCSDEDIKDFMTMGVVSLYMEDSGDEYIESGDADIVDALIEDEEWELYRNSYSVLSERELDIIKKRLSGIGLKELSKEYGISMERVRQVESGGIKKMERYVNGL